MMISRPTMLGTACFSLCLVCFVAAPATFSAQSDESLPALNQNAEDDSSSSSTEPAPKQPAAETEPPTGPKASPKPPLDRVEPRDPTQPGPALRDLLAPPQATPRGGRPVLPKISLKGRVIPSGKPGSAILEVDGQVLSIQSGEESTITSSAGLVTLRLSHLDVSEVRLTVLPLDQELVLR